MYTFLLALMLLDALILTTSILLQAGQGGGLASLGGGAGTDMFMGGRQTVTLLTKLSWWCAGIFLFLALMLAFMSSHNGGPRSVIEGNVQAPAPVQSSPLPLQSTPAPGAPAQQAPAPTPHP